jgi:hypothetical protein
MVELIGIIGSCFICVAFLFKKVIWIRLFDSVGAILFIIYGLMIHSFSTVLLNGILILIQLVNLYKLWRNKK